ncbi:MAG: sigma 54-interacting transcriptional regulator [Planctomycetota bacterium]
MEESGSDTYRERVYTFLTMTQGARSGTNYLLSEQSDNKIGRGIDCDVVLADPLCSRVHAEVFLDEADGWMIRDASSRNGTYVDDQKIDAQPLHPGNRVKLGSTEFLFQVADQPPTLAATRENQLTESIVREAAVGTADTGRLALAALRRTNNAAELQVLFELALRLLGCDAPSDVIRLTISKVQERTSAEVVGFLWVTEDGELKPHRFVPEAAEPRVHLSRSLTSLVLEQRRAIWVANQNPSESSVDRSAESLRGYADALCVPVIHGGQVLGALHLYLGDGRFRDIEFDFAISVSQVFGVALARANRQAQLAADHSRLVASTGACDDLMGESPVMLALKERIERVAVASSPVLVVGESGSGKELVARAVHKASQRSGRPLLAVNCAALPANLVESQLFGHVKGAFTGATNDHVGWFEQANTGTLFLDEIGELPLEAQAKLLRTLEGHPFQPVGGTREINVDVRVIAATNRNLRKMVSEKQFREDLFFRLSVFELSVPPLRDREDDIETLIDYFLAHFAGRHGRQGIQFAEEAKQTLLEYAWPGNVRQLRNVIDSAIVMANGDLIQTEDLGLHDAGTDHLETLKISDWERKLIRRALDRANGSVPEAAKLLGIGRATLYRKIDDYDIAR